MSIFPCANSATCNKRKSVSLKVEEATTSIKEVGREALGGRGRMGAKSHWAKVKWVLVMGCKKSLREKSVNMISHFTNCANRELGKW